VINDDFVEYINANGDISGDTSLDDSSLSAFGLIERISLRDDAPVLALTWEDLQDYGFAREEILGSLTGRIPLRCRHHRAALRCRRQRDAAERWRRSRHRE
jgi:hypothetical protein